MNENQKQMESSVFPGKVQEVKEDGQLALPTWGALVVLILAFIILKSFIYIKDKKRDGK